jgi:phosphoadenosine phosphosulfate reductase
MHAFAPTGKHQAAWTEEMLAGINSEFVGQPAEALLDWATSSFGATIALTCSFSGPSGMVLLDMVARLGRATPIIFLDTDLLFPETYALVNRVEERYGINVERQRPVLTLEEQARLEGPALYEQNPDRCCAIRKVTPLSESLRPYKAWISGIRRDQSSTRASTRLVEWSSRHNLLKINPLASWSERDVWRYIHANEVPYNPLLDQGYPSIGCHPCTRPASGDDPRAGRWNGFAKVECGIHQTN